MTNTNLADKLTIVRVPVKELKASAYNPRNRKTMIQAPLRKRDHKPTWLQYAEHLARYLLKK